MSDDKSITLKYDYNDIQHSIVTRYYLPAVNNVGHEPGTSFKVLNQGYTILSITEIHVQLSEVLQFIFAQK